MMVITPSQLKTLLAAAFSAEMNILITGAPGIGKTEIIQQAAKEADADVIVSHPAVEDPTDAKGLPWPGKGSSEAAFLPFGNLAKALKATKLTVWDLEDLGQANPAVQASYMPLLKDHRPKHVTFVASTNRRVDRAGVTGILEPVKSRFDSIVELEATIDDWCIWAYDNAIPGMLIAFLRYRTELLSAFKPTADLTNSPSPRTWAHVARIEALNLPAEIEAIAFAGAVGEAAALEYITFRGMARSLVNIDSILLNPDTAPLPTKPDQWYATSIGLAGRANEKNFSRVATYVTRMATEEDARGNTHGEHAVLTVRDAQRRDPKIAYSDAFVKMKIGPIGKLFTGQN